MGFWGHLFLPETPLTVKLKYLPCHIKSKKKIIWLILEEKTFGFILSIALILYFLGYLKLLAMVFTQLFLYLQS